MLGGWKQVGDDEWVIGVIQSRQIAEKADAEWLKRLYNVRLT